MKKVFLNQKSNFTKEEYLLYLKKIEKINSSSEIILCPSACYLTYRLPSNLELGSQNVSIWKEGSHTGEIASRQLKSLGVSYCLIGHYERKRECKETQEDINQKLNRLLEEEIIPVLCTESMEELESELINRSIIEQEKIIIAYEPTTAIGTGNLPNLEELETVIEKVKKRFPNNLLIYGGSIDEKNIEQLKKISNLDGYLLGNLSLDLDKLEKFLQVLEK